MSTEKVTYLLQLRDKFSKNLNTANSGLSRLDRNAQTASISLRSVGSALGALGILAAGKAIFQAGVNMEQTRVAFATFLKDADKANKVITELNQFSNVTPFNNEEVIKSGRVLLAANTPAEKLTATLKNIGDVASGSQVPITELSSIYAKIMNKGKAQAEELNQLAERGIPVLDVLATKFGTTAAGVLEMGSKGKITADVMAEAFSTMSSEGGMFFNMMEKQSATTGGKLSTLQGSLGLLAAELGESANPAISELIDKLISLTNYLKDNKETVITIVKWTARLATAFVAYKATVFATQKAVLLYNAVQKTAVITNIFLTKGLKKARVAMRLFNVTAKANPIGLIVSGLVLAIPLLMKLFGQTQKLSVQQRVLNEVNAKAASIYAESASRLNVLKATLESGNLTQKKRGEIIKDLNKNYGQYLDKLLTEKSTDEEIAKALEQVNIQLLRKAKLQAIEEKIKETSKKQLELELLRNDAERTRQKATEGFWAKLKILSAKIHFRGGEEETRLTREEQEKLKEEYIDTEKELKALLDMQKEASKGIKAPKIKPKYTPKGDGPKATLDEASKDRLETGIKAGAPKIINVSIGNLVESFNIETTQINEAPIRVKEEMTKVLLEAFNDATLLQG